MTDSEKASETEGGPEGGPGGGPGGVAPPLGIYLAALALGIVADVLGPAPLDWGAWGRPVGIGAVAAGGGLIVLSLVWFRRAGTTMNPYGAASAIVDTGPFRFSRNPIYVGMTLGLAGAGAIMDTAWVPATLLVVLPVMQVGVIRREERFLEAKFGDAYRDYKTRVRRWL